MSNTAEDTQFVQVPEWMAQDAWINAIGDLTSYDPCPCGCGRKWRFVVKDGEAAIKACEDRFTTKWKTDNGY